jgi:hypothetical protein
MTASLYCTASNREKKKTNKLQVLLIVNGILVSVLQLAGGFKADN